MSIPRLEKSGLLAGRLVDSVKHEDLSGNVGEARIQTTCDQYLPIIETNCHRVRLKIQVFRDEFLRPQVLSEVVLQNQLRVVAVSKEVALGDRLDLRIEELKRVLVRELDHSVLKCANRLKKLVGVLGVQRHGAVLELVEG